MNRFIEHIFFALTLVMLCSTPMYSTQYPVSSIVALQIAINSASAGDTIVLANGHYTNNTISISTSNIVVMAATPGAVYLDGTDAITISGNYVSFNGFQFTSNITITGNVITVRGNNNTLTQLNFNGYSADHLVYISGLYNLVSYCNFQNKLAILISKGGTGDMVQIIPNASVPGYNTIRYCSFQHMPGLGGDFGNECIRIGDSQYSTYISRTVVEYCYFEDTGSGDSEAISVKSRENILRYNTMNNNPNAMFAFRNGDNNVAYSNFFIKSGGIRCKQANNIYCYNNYFGQAGVGQNNNLAGSGTRPVYIEYFGVGYGNNFNFIHNTFYECTVSEIQSGITNNTWANNIFKQTSGNIFTGTVTGTTFVGNIYFGTLGLSIPSGMTNTDPMLMFNFDGYYGLSSTSPAIGAASANYPALLSIPGIDTLLLDIQGQERPTTRTMKDVGCDQYTTGSITNRPLNLSDVGPSYLGGPITLSVRERRINVPSTFDLEQNFPNPFNPSTSISYSIWTYGHTSLQIFDILGRQVAVLVNEYKPAGTYSVQWNATTCTSGLYFCQLVVGAESKMIKMMLVK